MAITTTQDANLYGAATGRQQAIRGSGTLASLTASETTTQLLTGMGSLTVGSYYFRVPISGAGLIQITLKTSAVSGTPVVTFYRTLVDGVTMKGSATTLTTPSSTQTTDEVTTLAGERWGIVKVVISGGDSVTFSVAEFSTL